MNRDAKPLGRRVRDATRNALELVRLGKLGEDYAAPFEFVAAGRHHRLRRYASKPLANAPVAVLVPPLMLTAEIYDLAADTSAVTALGDAGIRPYVVDFGIPEREEGGMARSLDDHVRAVAEAIAQVRALEGKDVHLLGYSQGGMFVYQAAAWLRCEGIASVVTFGSPVDLHKNLPAVRSDVTGALVRALEPLFSRAVAPIEGLPGKLTSAGFRILSTRKEVEQRIEFLRVLHDRRALARRESRRRYLKGQGFVAWPGPAFRTFVDQFVVHNRLLRGGFVIDGRLASLSDLRVPVLAFYGTSDELARPATVKAVEAAAPEADVRFVAVPAGHFGIIVGARATNLTWPTVTGFLLAREGLGPEPFATREPAEPRDDLEPEDFELEIELFMDTAKRTAASAWKSLGEVLAQASDTADAVRYQEPRFRRLARIEPDVHVSPSHELARRARATPDATFFLFHDRAFSYAEADGRVTRVAKGLYAAGIRHGEHVAVWMATRPSFLTVVTALARLGAVAVVAPAELDAKGRAELGGAVARHAVRRIVTDPERAAAALPLAREVLVLGGGPSRPVAEGARDLEAIDPDAVVLSSDVHFDDGRARDLALIMLRRLDDGSLRSAPITNHRWALSAIGAAAACTVEPGDTVYAAVPLDHPTGILVAVGAALASGARLALPRAGRGARKQVDPEALLAEVRRTGATVVFYAGEMLRPLLDLPPSRKDRSLPVRLFAGSGMRRDLAARLRDRFGVDVMEFYAGTTHRAILADPHSHRPGAIGRVLPGSAEIVVLAADLATGELARDAKGSPRAVLRGAPGLLAVRLADDELRTAAATVPRPRIVEGLFTPEDAWMITSDVVSEGDDGELSFVDALSGFVKTDAGPVSTRALEDALYEAGDVTLAAVLVGDDGQLVAAVVTRGTLDGPRMDHALAGFPTAARPVRVDRLPELPLSEGFRPDKRALRRMLAEGTASERLVLEAGAYVKRS